MLQESVTVCCGSFPRLGFLNRNGARIYYWRAPEIVVSSSQKRAIQNYRTRLGERGLARFEVLGRDADRELIRALARRLAEEGPDASRLRAAVSQTITGEPPQKGGVLAALRRSPLVGADLDLARSREEGRDVEL
jgi:hypothetical protein